MTREMNKPDWHNNWIYRERTDNGTFMKEYFKANTVERMAKMMCRCDYNSYKERKLDDWIKPFFDNCCRMEKIEK